MYPYQDNSIIIIFILLIICCCFSFFYIIIIGVYIYYYYYSEPDGYKKYSRACVNGHNIDNRRYRNKSVRECAKLCDERDECLAFEIYEDHDGSGYDGGGGEFEEGDCQLNSSTNRFDCPGETYNLNLYVKETR